MNDFLGQKLSIGDYVTHPGRGNTTAEYGLILYRILGISPKGIKAQRLTVHYDNHDDTGQNYTVTADTRTSTLKKSLTLVRVKPPKKMLEVFNNPEQHAELIGTWLHGQSPIDWK